MISIINNTCKLLSRTSKKMLAHSGPYAQYSTKKNNADNQHENAQKHESQQDKPQDTKQQPKENAKEEKVVDKSNLLNKYNNLNKKIEDYKKQLDKFKDFEDQRANYKKLNQQLAEGRERITNLIEEGKRHWDKTKEKVTKIQDQQISKFGNELIKFNQVLKDLMKIKTDKNQQALIQGLNMTSRILLNTLQKFHFQTYEPLKQKYDPKKHTKVGGEGTQKDGVVVDIIEPGWIFKHHVLKNAQVHVGKKD